MKSKIYAFDFDGTLTTRDTLIAFLRYAFGTPRLLWGMLLHLPLLVLMKLHLADNGRTKERLFGYFFHGMKADDFNDLCRRFARDRHNLLRPQGVETLQRAKADGARVLVVSASIDNWVQPFVPEAEVVGTQIEVADGVLTGRFLTPNCYGQEKMRRLLAACPDRESYHLTAFGDSRGDRELLAFADEAHYKPFRSLETSPSTIHYPLSTIHYPLSTIHYPLSTIQEAWPLLLSVTLWVALLNVLMLCKFYEPLFLSEGELPQLIHHYFHFSGFDAVTYRVLTDWGPYYDVVRHPLLPWMLYPLFLLNQALWWLTGVNCAMPLTCLLLTFCALCSSLLFYRIERCVIGIGRWDAMLLAWLFSSFAYVMATFLAPDHFALSQVLLLWVFSHSSPRRSCSATFTPFALLLTAGVTLTNGAKVVLSELFGRGRRFWNPRFLFLSIVLPLALVLGAAWVQHRVYVLPKEQAQQQYEKEHRRELMKQARENHRKYKNAPWVIHKGRPIGYGQPKEGNELSQSLLRWTDITTPRWDSTVENLLGESIQFHEQHVLEDVLVYYRPVLLEYEGWWHYAVELLLVALFVAGCWLGRRTRLLWLLLCCASIDLAMHIGLGFAINEVYIMSAHWLFTLPLVVGFLFVPGRPSFLVKSARVLVSLLTLYLIIYNGWQLLGWLHQPIMPPPFDV